LASAPSIFVPSLLASSAAILLVQAAATLLVRVGQHVALLVDLLVSAADILLVNLFASKAAILLVRAGKVVSFSQMNLTCRRYSR